MGEELGHYINQVGHQIRSTVYVAFPDPATQTAKYSDTGEFLDGTIEDAEVTGDSRWTI